MKNTLAIMLFSFICFHGRLVVATELPSKFLFDTYNFELMLQINPPFLVLQKEWALPELKGFDPNHTFHILPSQVLLRVRQKDKEISSLANVKSIGTYTWYAKHSPTGPRYGNGLEIKYTLPGYSSTYVLQFDLDQNPIFSPVPRLDNGQASSEVRVLDRDSQFLNKTLRAPLPQLPEQPKIVTGLPTPDASFTGRDLNNRSYQLEINFSDGQIILRSKANTTRYVVTDLSYVDNDEITVTAVKNLWQNRQEILTIEIDRGRLNALTLSNSWSSNSEFGPFSIYFGEAKVPGSWLLKLVTESMANNQCNDVLSN